jgi:hypothetical protein
VVVFSITGTSAYWVVTSCAPGAYTLQLSADVTGYGAAIGSPSSRSIPTAAP